MRRTPIGLVGLGFGRWVLELELLGEGRGTADVEVRAVCDVDADRLDDVRRTHGLRTHAGLDELLDDAEIEAVALFTGPVGRAELIRRIVATGRPVMTTKPFERDPRAARSVLEEARAAGVAVHCNSPGPELPPDVAQVLAWRDGHDLGRPVAAHWHTWCSYHEQPDGSWYDDPDACPVAPLYRIGVYGVNELVAMLGAPAEVQVATSRIRTGRPTADDAAALLRWPDGTIATLAASFAVDDGTPYPDELTVQHERATIRRRAATRDGERVALLSLRGPGVADDVELPRPESARYRWDLFRRAVEQPGHAPLTPPVDTLVDGIRVVDALARAERSGTREVV